MARPSSWGRLVAVAVAAALASGASAEERRVGAWSVGLTKEKAGAFASTASEDGGELGLFCYPDVGACIWILANDVGCVAGESRPVLVNSDSGAAVMEILCLGVEGKAAYAFKDFDLIDGIVRKAKRAVVAFPTENGRLRLSGFSLVGASQAVARMREVVDSMPGKPAPEPAPTPEPARVSF
jgi:hypothetical protein